jgi:hypothetical protein
MSARAPRQRQIAVTWPVDVISFGTYATAITTYQQFAPPAAAGADGWLDLGADYEDLAIIVKGGSKGAVIVIETTEDPTLANADLQTLTLNPPANGSDSYEIKGGLRRYYRASGNSADGAFLATTVDICVKGVSR